MEKNMLNEITEDDYLGCYHRDEILVLPADEPKDTLLGRSIRELPADNKSMELNFVCYEEMATNNNIFDYSNRAFETDLADKFLGYSDYYVKDDVSFCWTSIKVLKELEGKPWNNLALSYLSVLRPSSIVVIGKGQPIHLDCQSWRVHVFLKDDNRTIDYIEQEVQIKTIGVKTGTDFQYKIKGEPLPKPSNNPNIYINSEGIKKLNLGT